MQVYTTLFHCCGARWRHLRRGESERPVILCAVRWDEGTPTDAAVTLIGEWVNSVATNDAREVQDHDDRENTDDDKGVHPWWPGSRLPIPRE